jgi:hypothetical protein
MFCGRPEDAALLHLIIQARPLAPALAEEIWMVARLTPHALVELLPQSTPEQATRSLAMLFKSFAEARQKLQHPQHYARPSDPVSLEQKKVDHCIDAIYHFTGHRQRLDSQGQIFLDQQTDHFQLSKI